MTVFDGLDGIFTECLGEAVTYVSSQTRETTTINGIFDDEYLAVGEPGLVDVETTRPVIHVSRNDVADARHGDTVERANGERYRVCGVEPDGRDMVMLELEAC